MVTNYQILLKAPYTGEEIALIAQASVEDAKRAIENAHLAYQEFNKVPAYERSNILHKAVHLLDERKEEAARIIALEAAKPIKTARVESCERFKLINSLRKKRSAFMEKEFPWMPRWAERSCRIHHESPDRGDFRHYSV
jgi:acyl-CoA reductase-like NAD-dependent aldehyde dehydrogenase